MNTAGNIYLVGASGTGKSSLAAELANIYGLKVLPSAARMVAAEMGVAETRFEDLISDATKFSGYQRRVALKQIELEDQSKERFISCRAFDCIVFEALFGGTAGRTYSSPEFQEYLKRFSPASSLNMVFFLRPHATTNELARQQGDRLPYLDWDMVLRFDGGMEVFLEMHGYSYFSLNFHGSLSYRVAAARDYLDLMKFKGTK